MNSLIQTFASLTNYVDIDDDSYTSEQKNCRKVVTESTLGNVQQYLHRGI